MLELWQTPSGVQGADDSRGLDAVWRFDPREEHQAERHPLPMKERATQQTAGLGGIDEGEVHDPTILLQVRDDLRPLVAKELAHGPDFDQDLMMAKRSISGEALVPIDDNPALSHAQDRDGWKAISTQHGCAIGADQVWGMSYPKGVDHSLDLERFDGVFG